MPILEFRCASCEKDAELIILAGDGEVEPVCPSCGSPELRRLLSIFATHTGHGGARTADTPCGGESCANPGMCGPSDCGFGEN